MVSRGALSCLEDRGAAMASLLTGQHCCLQDNVAGVLLYWEGGAEVLMDC